MKTFKEKKNQKLKKEIDEFKKTKIYKDIMEAFPDLEIEKKKDE